jgi:hypothetical protein
MAPLLSVGIGVACCQVAFGFAYLVWGLRGNAYQGGTVAGRLLTRYFAPVGLLWILSGAFSLLIGHVPDAPLITLGVLSFAGVVVWAVRVRRTFKAHAEALKKAGQSAS